MLSIGNQNILQKLKENFAKPRHYIKFFFIFPKLKERFPKIRNTIKIFDFLRKDYQNSGYF